MFMTDCQLKLTMFLRF